MGRQLCLDSSGKYPRGSKKPKKVKPKIPKN